jgi:hypothetical protein
MSAAKLQPTVEPISEASLKLIRSCASESGIDADEFSMQQTGKPLESLTKEQGLALLKAVLKFWKLPASHTHPCFECGVDVLCFCNEPNENRLKQCRPCHEGFGRQEFNRTFAHSF